MQHGLPVGTVRQQVHACAPIVALGVIRVAGITLALCVVGVTVGDGGALRQGWVR